MRELSESGRKHITDSAGVALPQENRPGRQSRIDIKIGYACNNLCMFCVQGNKRQVRRDMPFQEVVKILKANAHEANGVVFTGGEPSMRNDLPHLVQTARELGYNTIQIQTNGRAFASRAFCRTMAGAGATEFALALHGHNAGEHDYLTRAPGSFEQTARGILNLKSEGRKVITNTVITRPNFRSLPGIARLLVKLGVNQYQCAFVHAVGSAHTNFPSIVPRKTLVAPYVHEALDIGVSAGVRAMTEAIPLCFMKGYESFVAETMIPFTKIFEITNVIEDFKEFRIRKGKAHGRQCRKCASRENCEGPWREYPAVYGWDEFIPI